MAGDGAECVTIIFINNRVYREYAMLKKSICFIVVGLFAIGFFVGLQSAENIQVVYDIIDPSLKIYPSHTPIKINSDADFNTPNGVKNPSASGNASDPYIIEEWDINASSTLGIKIANTTKYFVVRNCSVHDGTGYAYNGINILNVTNGKIENCTVSKNNFGMIIESPNSNISVLNNIVTDNYYGIFMFSSKNNTVSYNRISGTQGNAIVLTDQCANNTLSFNRIIDNHYNGIWISSLSTNNTIVYNRIANNFKYGLVIENSHYNRINNNNFIGNNQATSIYDPAHIQANDSAGLNSWNASYPNGGNYWSDWTSPDVKSGPNQDQSGSDGIVDFPYLLDGGAGANDFYPLTIPVVPEPSPALLVMIFVLLITAIVTGYRKR